MPKLENLAAEPSCRAGDYFNSEFHKGTPIAQSGEHDEINREVMRIRMSARDYLHSDSAQGELKIGDDLARLIKDLHNKPDMERAVIDKLAQPDATNELPVANIVENNGHLTSLMFVPGCKDKSAKNSAVSMFISDVERYGIKHAD